MSTIISESSIFMLRSQTIPLNSGKEYKNATRAKKEPRLSFLNFTGNV